MEINEFKEKIHKLCEKVKEAMRKKGYTEYNNFSLTKMGGCKFCSGWWVVEWNDEIIEFDYVDDTQTINTEKYGHCHNDFGGNYNKVSISKEYARYLFEHYNEIEKEAQEVIKELEAKKGLEFDDD